MRPNELVVRCYVRKQGAVWVAVCIDFSLAAQADSPEEAKDKLAAQIRDYLVEALAGDDRQHAPMLLARKAPLSQRLTYARYAFTGWVRDRLHVARNGRGRPFKAALPLMPATC